MSARKLLSVLAVATVLTWGVPVNSAYAWGWMCWWWGNCGSSGGSGTTTKLNQGSQQNQTHQVTPTYHDTTVPRTYNSYPIYNRTYYQTYRSTSRKDWTAHGL